MKLEKQLNNPYVLLAEAFCYPAPGLLSELKDGLKALPGEAEGVKSRFHVFLDKIGHLTLGEWEELHTRTLDLDPPAAPYVGFQTWGETYQRGVFLSIMNRELLDSGIDPEGELADHLIPVMRYLGQMSEPLPELNEMLAITIRRMLDVLGSADPGNPYLDLLGATSLACKDLKKEAA